MVRIKIFSSSTPMTSCSISTGISYVSNVFSEISSLFIRNRIFPFKTTKKVGSSVVCFFKIAFLPNATAICFMFSPFLIIEVICLSFLKVNFSKTLPFCKLLTFSTVFPLIAEILYLARIFLASSARLPLRQKSTIFFCL